jgi:hypothetical protein
VNLWILCCSVVLLPVHVSSLMVCGLYLLVSILSNYMKLIAKGLDDESFLFLSIVGV